MPLLLLLLLAAHYHVHLQCNPGHTGLRKHCTTTGLVDPVMPGDQVVLLPNTRVRMVATKWATLNLLLFALSTIANLQGPQKRLSSVHATTEFKSTYYYYYYYYWSHVDRSHRGRDHLLRKLESYFSTFHLLWRS